MLKDEGAKSIKLNATVHNMALEYAERKTAKRRALHDAFGGLFNLTDDDCAELENAENLTVRLEFSFNSRKRGGELSKVMLGQAAHEIITDGEDRGFAIVTGSGNTLTAEDVRVHKTVQFQPIAKSISREVAWHELMVYYQELRRSGKLDT